jgi:hypothetical protein
LRFDDESLKSGDWKKLVGGFLVKAKRILIDWTNNKTTVTSAAELDELRQQILDEAAATDVLAIPSYAPMPTVDIARSIELIVEAMKPLGENDSIRYLSSSGATEINTSFEVVPEVLKDILVKESLESTVPMILIVKRPDFLGDSRWEFRHGKQPIDAKLIDATWITEFRNGTIVLRPGDALRAMVLSIARYGYDGELIDSKHDVLKVLEVIHALRPSQGGLFKPPN